MSIQVFKPKYDVERCLEEIRECLEIGWTGIGFKTEKFENEWKKYTNYPNAFYVNSATAALNLAFDVLKTEEHWDNDSEVISTPLTFVSTNHAILKTGMKVTFADVDESLCLDPISIRSRITAKTKAICFVAFGGNMGRYSEVVEICKEFGLKLILDAAHMAGTRLDGKIPGIEADVVCWSFQAVKNLPTGDSGMLCFRNENYDKIARQRAWLGINKDTYKRISFEKGTYKWKYDVDYVGNKYHGNSIMASIAIAQLPHLDQDNEKRRDIGKTYKKLLSDIGQIRYPFIDNKCSTSQHLFPIIIEKRDECLMFLNDKGIYPGVHYVVNTEYSMYKYGLGTCPNAEYYSNHLLSLPCHLWLSDDDIKYISDCLHEFFEN